MLNQFWDVVNPWRDELVYITKAEFAMCVDSSIDDVETFSNRKGSKVDFYILKRSSFGHYSIGARYGAEGHEYLSPLCRNNELAKALVEKYSS